MSKTRTKHGEKARFMKALEWDIAIEWFDRTGYHVIDERKRAKIELITTGTSQHFTSVRVQILDKEDGKIDEKVFKFDDYLENSKSMRKDGRDDYPLGGNICFEVITYVGWHWYIAEPKTTRPFCKAIEDWTKVFR